MKQIDGHAMIQRVEGLYKMGAVDLSYYNIVKEAVQMEPAVDAEPVVHGRWVISPGCLWPIGDCSVCGEQHIGTNSAKYCPNCGAKMDLETDH